MCCRPYVFSKNLINRFKYAKNIRHVFDSRNNFTIESLSQDQQEIVICSLNEELYRVNPVEEECPQYACSEYPAASP